MGIFSDNVTRLYDHGLVCIPVGDRKNPIQQSWQDHCESVPPREVVEEWEAKFTQIERIGLCLGRASGLVAFDFDYCFDQNRSKVERAAFDKDFKMVQSLILERLPQTPATKVGKKGWTKFYKWTPTLDADSNMQADRNGVRLFDFLSWHKQTILPPSLHSMSDGQPLYYRWTGLAPLEECLDDIPEISLDLVRELKLMLGDQVGFDKTTRHGKLFAFGLGATKVEQDPDRLAELLIQKDAQLNRGDARGLYLVDKKHFRSSDAKTNAKTWAQRILKWKSAKSSYKQEVEGDADVWDLFFMRQFPFLRKDILSEKVMVKRDPDAEWVDIASLEGVLRAYASRVKLPRPQVKEQLDRFVFEKTDVSFLCDLPAWDGIDRVQEFGRAIKSQFFTAEEITEVLKHWGSNVFRRVADSETQNRCLLLKGGQGIGKDTLVRSMFSAFKPYFETTTLSGTPKDVYEIISRLYILHIEEFDQTKNLDIAFLKSIITQSSSFFRESYGRSPTRKNVAVNFISTANVDDILRDPTGNRRFIVIPVDGIDWNYPQEQSQQVIAQMISHLERDEFATLSPATEKKIKAILEAYTPPDPNQMIVDVYLHDSKSAFGQSTELAATMILNTLNDVARKCGVSLRRVQTVLKVHKYSRHTRDGVRYYSKPDAWYNDVNDNLEDEG